MANTPKVRGRTFIAGAGFDANGNAKQGKVLVHGRIEVTSAVAGETLKPSDVELTTIDYIDIRHENPHGGASGGEHRTVGYDFATQEFYVLQDDDSTTPVGSDHNLRFVAFGDAAADVELL